MARTGAQLVDEVLGLVQSWATASQVTTLVGGIGPTDLALTFTPLSGNAAGVSVGVVEIDQELIYVTDIDQTSGVATVPPWGRGYLGTTAATHSASSKVTSQPAFPRAWVWQRINESIDRVYPDVYAIRQVELTTTTVPITYQLPNDAEFVLEAKWQQPGGFQYWSSVRRYRMSPGGGTRFGDMGRTVDVLDYVLPGRPIQFLYAALPSPMVNEADDFATTTGLRTGLVDVVALGAAARLLLSSEGVRAAVGSVEQQNRATTPPQTALTLARYYESQFQTRLKEERMELVKLYPPRIERQWA